ncbi:MAG: serine hydrolase, partial [Acidobacteria bacterium]|nr:serine hydrolase [Candidatus Sulfomarinibacter kjeldsenii]
MHRVCVFLVVFACFVTAFAGDRIPGEEWMSYVDPTEAGFDPARLEGARARWEEIPSSAFLVISDGAVVAAWGDVDRRFMCHSVRKSFMSAIYGIYWDRGEIELNKTLVDLGIDDQDDVLLESEKQARILDLLKARSGIFHPAAYAGRTDSQPRGSQGPGRYFAYNNWDFNTLVTILEQETGDKVFEAFDQHFAGPLEMEDWRLSDGYYHYERDKSMHPAYPFRLSARDAARFGLVYTREIVNRANTYEGQRTPMPELLDLIEAVLEARAGEPKANPELAPLAVPPSDPRLKSVSDEKLAEFAGEWPYPPAPLGMPTFTTVSITVDDGALVAYSDVSGTFREYLQLDGSFVQEDSLERYIPISDGDGLFAGIADSDVIARAAVMAAVADDMAKAKSFLALTEGESGVWIEVARATIDLLDGRKKKAEKSLAELAANENSQRVEGAVNFVGYSLLEAERPKSALKFLKLNTELFPEAFNTWDSLGEAHMKLGNDAKAISSFEKSL